jgi:hypothetical protein
MVKVGRRPVFNDPTTSLPTKQRQALPEREVVGVYARENLLGAATSTASPASSPRLIAESLFVQRAGSLSRRAVL